MKKLWVFAALIGLSAFQAPGAVLFPSLFAPVRSAIAEELDFLTNSPSLTPEERRGVRLLSQARRTIDRAGRPTLFGDVQILASLTTSLTHAFPDGEFDPLLQATIADYAVLLGDAAGELSQTIGELPPSSAATLASNTVSGVVTMLEQLDPFTDVTTGVRTITRAATRLRSAEGFMSRARSVAERGSRFTALVNGRRFNAHPSAITATYSVGTETLTIVARELGGAFSSNRVIQLVLSDVASGTSSHLLGSPATDDYATFSASSPTNAVTLTSLSGNALVTFNPVTGLVNGRFSFDAGDQFGGSTPVRITSGDFSLRLQSR